MTTRKKRPRDPVQLAKLIGDIATGAVIDQEADAPEMGDTAETFGRKGGEARARKLTAEERAEIARKAANRRWQKGPAPRGRKERT
jgi:hypothetical protein